MGFELMNVGPGVAAPRQRVENAAVGLQVARLRHLSGDGPWELLTLPDGVQQIVDLCAEARDVVSVQQRANPLEVFRRNHQDNRRIVDTGVSMQSYYDTRNLTRPLLEFMASADLPYHCCYGPVQMKLLDGERVLVDGPIQDGYAAVLHTAAPDVVAAAHVYLRAVRATAILASDFLDRQKVSYPEAGDIGELLTQRQREIAALLDTGATDEEIARALGLSVRTVGGEVSRMMQVLGARNRWGAGRRYGELAN